uniref:DUF2428 domain-containing protein n=1 Tax=Schistosoma haematobium TaxID=6185 RepID=A0A094ZTF2_SCHHA
MSNKLTYDPSFICSSISHFIIDRLKRYSVTVLLQSISLAKVWCSFIFLNVLSKGCDDCLTKCAKAICRSVYLHAGSSNGNVEKSVQEFFLHILGIILTLNKKDSEFLPVFKAFVNDIIPCYSVNVTRHYKLPKNSIHCLLSVVKCLGLVEVFNYDSFLMWSLLLGIEYNCTSNVACDIIKSIFEQSQFTLLPSSDALESILVVSDLEALQLSKNDLLIDQLLEHLSLTFLNSKDDQYSDINERKLLVWLRLYSLKDYSDLPLSVKQLVPTILTHSASHHNDCVRILALNGIHKFLCKYLHLKSKANHNNNNNNNNGEESTNFILSNISTTQIFMDIFLTCCNTFNNCSNPSYRNQFQKLFSSLTECIRMICKSIRFNNSIEISNNDNLINSSNQRIICLSDTEMRLQVFDNLFDLNRIKDESVLSMQENDVLYLVKLISFISSMCHITTIHTRTGSKNTTDIKVTTSIHTYFWPGMSYQRAKLLVDIVETALGVLNLTPNGPWNKKSSKWRSEFGKDSLCNIRTIIDNISVRFHWDYKSTNLLRYLLNGLLYVSSDLQSQILSIIYDHWIENKGALKEAIYPTMVDLACAWCDTPWCSVYTSGANILTFCSINELWDSAYFGADMRTWFLNKLKRFSELTWITNNSLSNVDLAMFSSKLLQVVQFQSCLGFLLTIDQILTNCLSKLVKNSKNIKWNQFIDPMLYEFICCKELPSLCLELCNLCLFSMGCQICQFNQENNSFVMDFSKGACSFRELGKAILKTVMLARRNQSLSIGSIPLIDFDLFLSTGIGICFITINETVGQSSQCHLIQTSHTHTTDNSTIVNNVDSSDMDSLNSIELLPEYQHILSWSWNTLKFCSSIIANWFAIQCKLAVENVMVDVERKLLASKIGYQLLHQLLQCRHKGTIEALYFNLLLYLQTVEKYQLSFCSSLKTCKEDALKSSVFKMDCKNPTTDIKYLSTCDGSISADHMLQICWKVLCNSAYSVTRRGAGLIPVIRACLLVKSCNGLESPPCSLVCCLKSLFEITQSDDNDVYNNVNNNTTHIISDSTTLHDSPRVFALHLLHGLFTDARLRVHEHSVPVENNNSLSHVKNWTIEALQLAVIPGFNSKKWNVWNGALQLHSALIYRLTGVSLDLEFPLISDICFQYPQMLDIIFNCLNSNYQNLSSTQSLISILTLIVRFSPSFDHSLIVSSKIDEILNRLEYILFNHCSMHIRKLASKAYHVFLCPPIDLYYQFESIICSQDKQSSLCNLSSIGPLNLIYHSCSLHNSNKKILYNSITNAVHGHLCLLQSWYESKTCEIIQHWRESLFNIKSALNYLLHWISISAWYLAYELCILMNSVYTSHATIHCEEDYRTELWTALLTLRKPIFSLSNEPFHIEFLIEFRHICIKLFNKNLFNYMTIHYAETEPILLLRFLNLLKTNSNLSDELTLKLIDYWINWRSLACAVDHHPGHRYMDQWLTLLSDCLQYQHSTESRILASKSLQLWTLEFHPDNATKSPSISNQIDLMKSVLNISQRKRLLDCIFHGLFDESPEVRSILSTVINFWLKSSINQTNSLHCIHANTHLITLHKLLKQIVPLLLLNENNNNKDKNINSNNTHNKIHSSDNLTFNDSTHWLCNNWLTIMKSMNCLMINEYESSQRNMLYDREAYNTFCEPRLQIDLLFTYLRMERNMSKENLLRVTSSLIDQADDHLLSVCNVKGLQIEKILATENWCGPVVPFAVFTRDYSRQLINSLKE